MNGFTYRILQPTRLPDGAFSRPEADGSW